MLLIQTHISGNAKRKLPRIEVLLFISKKNLPLIPEKKHIPNENIGQVIYEKMTDVSWFPLYSINHNPLELHKKPRIIQMDDA